MKVRDIPTFIFHLEADIVQTNGTEFNLSLTIKWSFGEEKVSLPIPPHNGGEEPRVKGNCEPKSIYSKQNFINRTYLCLDL